MTNPDDSSYEAGYTRGYEDCEATYRSELESPDETFEEGREEGYSQGYDEGWERGHDDGYKEGYRDGETSVDKYDIIAKVTDEIIGATQETFEILIRRIRDNLPRYRNIEAALVEAEKWFELYGIQDLDKELTQIITDKK